MALRPDDVTLAHATARLGVGGDDLAALGETFCQAMAALGIDGAPVFEHLAAGRDIGQALSVSSEVIDALYARAHGWFALGRAGRALTLFRALCLLDAGNADYWVGYGVCLRLTQQPEHARRAFTAAARLRPAWAVPHFHALELAIAVKRPDEARVSLAAYEERASRETPPAIVQEARRLRAFLASWPEVPCRSADTPHPAGSP